MHPMMFLVKLSNLLCGLVKRMVKWRENNDKRKTIDRKWRDKGRNRYDGKEGQKGDKQKQQSRKVLIEINERREEV